MLREAADDVAGLNVSLLVLPVISNRTRLSRCVPTVPAKLFPRLASHSLATPQ